MKRNSYYCAKKFGQIKHTYRRESLGLIVRFTRANFLVFFALPMGVGNASVVENEIRNLRPRAEFPAL